jgi:uncharacterized protein
LELAVYIEIEDLKQDPVEIHQVYGAGKIRLDRVDAVLSEPVSTDFVLRHKDRDLHIDGSIRASISYKCSRCLKECEQCLDPSFELLYLPQPKWLKVDDEIELKYDEMDISYYDGVRFDVDQMVLEQIELSMPMRFICKEDCRGLCCICGADLNEKRCNCTVKDTDSRFSALLEFRKKME